MELRDLRTFVAVVDAGGVTRAAERLHVVQSAVSQTIRRLERDVALDLFERRRDGMRLTEAGAALDRHARAILNSVACAQDDMTAFRDVQRGRVQVGLVHTAVPILLPPLLRLVGETYPGLEVRIREGRVDELLELLSTRLLDLAVIFLPAELPDAEVHQLMELDLAVLLASDHAAANEHSLHLRDLAHERWISFAPPNPGRAWLEAACADAGFAPASIVEVDTLAHMKTFVEAGAGIALGPAEACAAETRLGSLAPVRLANPPRVTLAYAMDVQHPSSLGLRALRPLLEAAAREAPLWTPELAERRPSAGAPTSSARPPTATAVFPTCSGTIGGLPVFPHQS